jgi:hypothetical protein
MTVTTLQRGINSDIDKLNESLKQKILKQENYL